METQNTKWRNDAITADITAKSEQANRQLLDQIAVLTKELDRRQTPVRQCQPARHQLRPAAAGRRRGRDRSGNRCRIGPRDYFDWQRQRRQQGQHLVVYRLKPRPEYVGTLSVIDSQPREAVARPIKPFRAGPVQKGDIVASRVLATGRQ